VGRAIILFRMIPCTRPRAIPISASTCRVSGHSRHFGCLTLGLCHGAPHRGLLLQCIRDITQAGHTAPVTSPRRRSRGSNRPPLSHTDGPVGKERVEGIVKGRSGGRDESRGGSRRDGSPAQTGSTSTSRVSESTGATAFGRVGVGGAVVPAMAVGPYLRQDRR
jgi:hypothetical protein